MRIIGLCFAAALVGGCSAEPLPVESPDDRAMSIVWEQTYGMERESRPVVTWHTECRTVDGTGNRATSIKAGCIVAMVHDDGAIELQAADLISDSAFALALEQWRGWLVTSSFAPVDGHAIGAAQAALRHAGL